MAVYRLSLKSRIGSTVEERNIFTYELGVGVVPDNTDWTALATILANGAKICLVNTLTFYGFTVHIWNDGLGKWQWSDEGVLNIAGTEAGEALPYQVAAVILAYTNFGKHIGKKFLGPISEADQSGGTLTAGAIADLQAFADIWGAAQTVNGKVFTPKIMDALHNTQSIRKVVANSILGTQRRRKPGVGI